MPLWSPGCTVYLSTGYAMQNRQFVISFHHGHLQIVLRRQVGGTGNGKGMCRYGNTLNGYVSHLESLVCQLFYRCVLIISPFSHRTGLPQSTQLVSDRGGNFSPSFFYSKALRSFPIIKLLLRSNCLDWKSLRQLFTS